MRVSQWEPMASPNGDDPTIQDELHALGLLVERHQSAPGACLGLAPTMFIVPTIRETVRVVLLEEGPIRLGIAPWTGETAKCIGDALSAIERDRIDRQDVEAAVARVRSRSPARARTTGTYTDAVEERRRVRRLLMERASQIEPERIAWFWPGYIPFGKVTTLEGDPGLGKSTLTMGVAAAVSRGRGDWLPGGAVCEAADVFIVSYEDGARDTIRPRLEAAGADLDRVHIIHGVATEVGEELITLPIDIPELEESVRLFKVALVVIDPLMASFSNAIDSYKDQHIRRALAPLTKFAERTGAAVLVVRHLPKGGGQRAINTGSGSVGIGAAARSVLMVGPSSANPERRILAVVKCNVAAMAASLEFSIESGSYTLGDRVETTAVVVWHGTSTLTADDLAAERTEITKSDATTQKAFAIECLREWLQNGPLPKQELLKLARREGISERTFERAARELKLERRRQENGRDHKVLWALPYGPLTHANLGPLHAGESESGGSELIGPSSDAPTCSTTMGGRQESTRATPAATTKFGENGVGDVEEGIL